jgi:hypothetical protein
MGVLARTTMPWDALEQSALITIHSALDESDSERNMHQSGLIQSILKTIAISVGLDINHVLRGMELERQCNNCLLWNAKQRCKACKATYFCSHTSSQYGRRTSCAVVASRAAAADRSPHPCCWSPAPAAACSWGEQQATRAAAFCLLHGGGMMTTACWM